VFSVKGGLQQLTNALAGKISSEHIITGVTDVKVSQHHNKFRVTFTSGEKEHQVSSAQVVTTIPGPALENMFDFINAPELEPVLDLRYARVVQVVAAYREWKGIPLNAFGGLIPSGERRDALGILFTSSIFNDRTPGGGAILSVFMGGDRRPEFIEKSDEEITALALQEIAETLGQKGVPQNREPDLQPDHLQIFRYPHAIPQYEASTEQRLEAIDKIEASYPGIHLAGNIRDGIGMADRVKQGYQVAQEIIKEAY
jgi:oxygen-dependent protoporphyrinogen oxidase